ncbi:TolC family protein [Echinicola vietnamensis]|uniref:Outer membrane protein n=1 Tax=Echinicola vietnamensis (strain DSM 17526 / LMG 23754 / KMM 6221) TaxID=926556 RepID=L0G167_ECHVK|nr:TolC family protein [Echinicola vietnamensis]AGA79954.1 outer membrane protein [Echinicola vietnamensis DSM 17526]
MKMRNRVLLWLMTGYLFLPGLLYGQEATGDPGQLELTLDQCIQYALDNGPAMQQAFLDERIGDREIKSSLSGWFPQISASAAGTKNIKLQQQIIGDQLITFGQNYNSSISLQVDQNLINREQIFAGRTSKYIKQQWDQNKTNVEIATVVDVSKAFYDVLLTYEQLKIIDENLVRLQKQYSDAKSRYESGLVDKTDYQRAAITLSNTRSNKRRADESVDAKLAYLKQLMGYPVDASLALDYNVEAMEEKALTDTSQVMLPENRIEFQQIQTEEQLAQLNTGYQKWAYLPTLTANYNYNWLYFNNAFSQLYDRSYPTSGLGLTLSLPIFQGGKRHQDIKIAELQQEKVSVEKQNLQKQINTEYKTALANYKSDLYEWKTIKENMQLAEEVYNIIKLQYDEGIKAYVDLIVAETELRTAQLSHFNAMYNLMSSKIDLDRALGNIEIN